jgi:hypothetical protein
VNPSVDGHFDAFSREDRFLIFFLIRLTASAEKLLFGIRAQILAPGA